MNSHFSEMETRKMKYRLELAEQSAYWSPRHQCEVVIFKCEDCERWYEEEKGEAIAKIVRGDHTLCIGCDKEAEETSVTGVRMTLWKVPGVKELWWRVLG